MKKLVLTSFNKQRSGITSILVVIVVGMVLSIMVAGIATLSVRELQQARNNEQSKKAFQTAESAVRVGTQKIISDANYSFESCPFDMNKSGASDYSSLFGDGLTCISVKDTFNDAYEGYLQADRTAQFYVGPNVIPGSSSIPYFMSLLWHDTSSNGTLASYITSGFYPTVYTDHAASLEVSFIYWPSTTNPFPSFSDTASGKVKLKTIFVTPGNADQGASAFPSSYQAMSSRCIGQNDWPSTVPSASGSKYACGMQRVLVPAPAIGATIDTTNPGFIIPSVIFNGSTYTGNNNYNYIIRIRPRYRDTNIRLNLYDSNGNQITYKSALKQVDVTAKSGSTYRRIKATVPGRSMALDNVFDSAIYSGDGSGGQPVDICKNLAITIDPNPTVFNYVIPNGSGTAPVCGQPWQGP